MDDLRQLCCGVTNQPGRLTDVLSILGNVIVRYGNRALSIIKSGSDEDKSMYGSFVARKLLESASSAILARIDPSRFLILQEYQQRAGTEYRAHERHPASIAWSGDIIPEKAVNNAWGAEAAPDKFVRALLGGHLAEIAWPNAINIFSKDESDKLQGLWIDEIANIYEEKRKYTDEKARPSERRMEDRAIENENNMTNLHSNKAVGTLVLDVFRARAQDTYSALSKGVHLEFIIDETVVLDTATVVEHMLSAIKLVSMLGFLSNYMDSTFTRVEPDVAAKLLFNVEKAFSQ